MAPTARAASGPLDDNRQHTGGRQRRRRRRRRGRRRRRSGSRLERLQASPRSPRSPQKTSPKTGRHAPKGAAAVAAALSTARPSGRALERWMQRHQPRRVACMCGRLMTTAQQLRRHLQAARYLTAQLPQQTSHCATRDARRCSRGRPPGAAAAAQRWLRPWLRVRWADNPVKGYETAGRPCCGDPFSATTWLWAKPGGAKYQLGGVPHPPPLAPFRPCKSAGSPSCDL